MIYAFAIKRMALMTLMTAEEVVVLCVKMMLIDILQKHSIDTLSYARYLLIDKSEHFN